MADHRPRALIFDVNETLSDLSPMAGRFADVGAPGHLAQTWFAQVLRDGFALASVDASQAFAHIADGALRVALHDQPLDRDIDAAVSHVLDGFADLDVHDDVPGGIAALHAKDLTLMTLSNGSATVADSLLTRAGIRQHFVRLLSVEDVGHWKPRAEAYRFALGQVGLEPSEAMLVAVHPWDIDGAARAGLATAWINRDGGPYPEHFRNADLVATSIIDLSDQLP